MKVLLHIGFGSPLYFILLIFKLSVVLGFSGEMIERQTDIDIDRYTDRYRLDIDIGIDIYGIEFQQAEKIE